MADEPIRELEGKTPLQVAHTPGMDCIARHGQCGTLFTLPEPFPTSSDVANMSVLGCDLEKEFCGRGVLEAAGQGITLRPQDIAFRVNLITVNDGILKDFSGGHIPQQDAQALIASLNEQLASDSVRFYAGVSYRNLLVLSGPEFSPEVLTEKPDDNQGNPIDQHLPKAQTSKGQETVKRLTELMQKAAPILRDHPINKKAVQEGREPANGIWPWSGGSAGAIRTLQDKFGVSSAVISAVDVINGLGRCLGMNVIKVPGATGYIDTNYEGKADAAVEALKHHDFVYVHVEAIDEVSHAMDLDLKIKTLEAFDKRVVQRALDQLSDTSITKVILPDHPVPVRLGRHTRTPVPVAIWGPRFPADGVQTYDEVMCPQGQLGELAKDDLMNLLLGPPRPLASS